MPKRLEKWEIKFCIFADSVSKFIYCFEIYCGKIIEAEVRILVFCEVEGIAYSVVINLLHNLEEKGHCIVMDNILCSVSLFKDLSKGIYATSTVGCYHIGLPLHLTNV
jgi:hypothetical protein